MTKTTYSEKRQPKHTTYTLAVTAVMTAVTCILSPFSIPIGPVPISLASLAIYLAVYLLGMKMGTISYLLYLLIGLIGVPVFSGFSAGPGQLAGPTGGYLVGFLFMAVISGFVIERWNSRSLQFLGMTIGATVNYIFGTAWFCILMDSPVAAALSLCVFPFIPGDLIKIGIALLIGPVLKNRLQREGLL